jgi:hypothetical protein
MDPVQEPITGREERGDLMSPQFALSQFYRAFNTRDMEAMAQNWATPRIIQNAVVHLAGLSAACEPLKAFWQDHPACEKGNAPDTVLARDRAPTTCRLRCRTD